MKEIKRTSKLKIVIEYTKNKTFQFWGHQGSQVSRSKLSWGQKSEE